MEAGTYDLVVDPSNLWLTIHESIGHATELDRAVGYEAAYAGTSFATFDKLGSLAYGSPVMHVTGDRTVEHGLATVGIDDEGVEAQSFDLVRDGTLVGYQLDRAIAASMGFDRSNGCAFADSPMHVPIQRMANVSLAHSGRGGPRTEDLIAGVDRGLYIVGDKSWSIDMQRYNFQFTGQRFYRIEGGKLAGQVKDVAYQATTTDFWGAMEAVGGASTWVLGGAFNCGKGQPGQVAPVSHGCPSVLVRGVRVLNTARNRDVDSRPGARGRRPRVGGRARAEDCMVLVEETSHADVRFALNTTTTNGVQRGRSVSVIAFRAGPSGRPGAAARSAPTVWRRWRPPPWPMRRRHRRPRMPSPSWTRRRPGRHVTSGWTPSRPTPARSKACCPRCPVRSTGPGPATPCWRALPSRTWPRCISAARLGCASRTPSRRAR